MAAPKQKPTRPAKKPARSKTRLTEIGEEAMRAALLDELRRHDWNLTRCAESLRMKSTSGVIRAIRSLGLDKEYEQARANGDVVVGRRPKES